MRVFPLAQIENIASQEIEIIGQFKETVKRFVDNLKVKKQKVEEQLYGKVKPCWLSVACESWSIPSQDGGRADLQQRN